MLVHDFIYYWSFLIFSFELSFLPGGGILINVHISFRQGLQLFILLIILVTLLLVSVYWLGFGKFIL